MIGPYRPQTTVSAPLTISILACICSYVADHYDTTDFYSSEHQLCFDNSRFAEVYDALGLRPLVTRIEAKDLGVHSKGTILEAVLYAIYFDARDRFDSETTAMLCLRAVMRSAGIYPRFKSVPFTTVLECDREFRAEFTKLKNFTKALCWYQYDIKVGREDQTEAEALQGMTPIPVPTKLRWKKASRKNKACTGARKVIGGVFDRPPMTPKPPKRPMVNKPMTKKEMSKDIVKDRVERMTSKLLDRVRGGRIDKRKKAVDVGEDVVKENAQERKTNSGKMTEKEKATQAEAKKQLEKLSWLVVTPRRGKKAVAWIKLPVSGKGEDVSSAEMKEELRQHIPNPTTAQKGRDITSSVGEGASGAHKSIFGPRLPTPPRSDWEEARRRSHNMLSSRTGTCRQ